MRCKYCGEWSGLLDNEHMDCARLAALGVAPEKKPKVERQRFESWSLFLLCCAVTTYIAYSPLRFASKVALMAAAIALYLLVLKLRRLSRSLVMTLAMQGRYNWALYMDKIFSGAAGYSKSLAGWIYVEAGRYEEGRLFFKSLAFDEADQPRLASFELLIYAITLSRKERYAEAQVLLEATTEATQEVGDAHLALADCLLAQGKDADRARSLVERVLESIEGKPMDHSLASAAAIAMHAYALAHCCLEEDSESRLRQAFAESTTFNKRDLAALNIVAGLTWNALNKEHDAHEAFRKALFLHPFGDIALRARKGMLKAK